MALERLLMLDLAAGGCAVEAQLNGMPVATLGAAGGSSSLAVHEYTLAGRNQLSLVIGPAPPGASAPSQPRIAIGATWARARLVLVRHGQSPADPGARVLGVVEWATAEGKAYDAPSTHSRDVELPVNFPRWRWLDAPPIATNGSGLPRPSSTAMFWMNSSTVRCTDALMAIGGASSQRQRGKFTGSSTSRLCVDGAS